MNTKKGRGLARETTLRLIKYVAFLESELRDFASFQSLSWERFSKERSTRRDVERWIENIINSSIDISKIILVAQNIPLPDTYKELVANVSLVPSFDKERMKSLSEWVRFRNIIAHEYLDIRWASIRKFIQESEPLYTSFLKDAKEYLDKQLQTDTAKT
jgi:uncharacterized protein YutE (UPF0331/DUF86 family)